jgi:hypothetical protein
MGNGPSQARYDEGIEYGDKCDYVTIGLRNVWGAKAGNADISSYERIGYHAGSADFILGVLATACPVYVAWDDGDGYHWSRVTLG